MKNEIKNFIKECAEEGEFHRIREAEIGSGYGMSASDLDLDDNHTSEEYFDAYDACIKYNYDTSSSIEEFLDLFDGTVTTY